jgi:hypothetical protein
VATDKFKIATQPPCRHQDAARAQREGPQFLPLPCPTANAAGPRKHSPMDAVYDTAGLRHLIDAVAE